MEELLREIIAPSSPYSPTEALSHETFSPASQIPYDEATTTPASTSVTMDWERELEMQRLLETFTGVPQEVEDIDFSSALEMELGEWDHLPSEIGVF